MVNLKQSNITILNGNLTYSNLYFVYVLTIFQNIHKCFDTLIKILKHTHNIFTIALIMGFMTNALNPKATIFFLAIFTTLVSPTTPMKVQFVYGVWMCSVNALWFMLVAVLFSRPIVRQQFLKMGKKFERVMGLILIALALKLLFTHL